MKYSVIGTPHPASDLHPIQIDEGEFAGCQLVYGAVSITDEGVLKFDYEIVNDYTVNMSRMESFVDAIGEILISMIEDHLTKSEVIYKGGS